MIASPIPNALAMAIAAAMSGPSAGGAGPISYGLQYEEAVVMDNTVTLPSDIQDGDIGIFYDNTYNTPVGGEPSGWTELAAPQPADYSNGFLYAKVLTAGDANLELSGPTGDNHSSYGGRIVLVLRPSSPASSLNLIAGDGEAGPAASTAYSATVDTDGTLGERIYIAGLAGLISVPAEPSYPDLATPISDQGADDASGPFIAMKVSTIPATESFGDIETTGTSAYGGILAAAIEITF